MDLSKDRLLQTPTLFIVAFICSDGHIKLQEVVMGTMTKFVPTTTGRREN